MPKETSDNTLLDVDTTLSLALEKAGYFSKSGCNPYQRQWIKERDGFRCQFYEPRVGSSGGIIWEQCSRQIDPKNPIPRNRLRWELQVHHIYPQYLQKTKPQRYGGENPYNLITLCAGMAGEIGHHDLLQPTMIIAKMSYKHDRWAYDRAIQMAHRAQEEGIQVYEEQYDYMLKAVARARTMLFLKRFPENPFPKHNVRN